MDFELCLAPDGDHCVLTNYADVTHQSSIQRQRAMQAFSDEHKLTRFLIDTRGQQFVGGPVQLYTFVRKTLPAEGYDEHWRVALVTSPDDDSHDFLETVSQNVGYQVMVFKNFKVTGLAATRLDLGDGLHVGVKHRRGRLLSDSVELMRAKRI